MSNIDINSTYNTPEMIVLGIFSVFYLIVLWKIFVKAGQPGWAAIIPIYNSYILAKIAFGNGWLFLLAIVPIVNFIYLFILYFKLAKSFGKSTAFGIGTIFLSIVFLPMLAFGSCEYLGPQN